MTGYPLKPLRVGPVLPFGRRGAPSGIDKLAVTGPVVLGPSGLAGDGQGDTRHHGGPEKALHHYPFEHYTDWVGELGPKAVLDDAGAFGENVSTVGLTEENVAVGDLFALGAATIEVSQGRQPCWKLNERFAVPDMAKRVQSSGRTGWYYRIVEPGLVSPEDVLIRLDRRTPEWTIRRIWRAFYVDTLNREELGALAGLPTLSEGWKIHARRRLETGAVEDWSRRLQGEK